MKRNAIYPGSFDPITNGHLDIIQRACRFFDEVTIAVLDHSQKRPLFTVEERLDLIRKVANPKSRITIESFSGLLADFLEQKKTYTVIRGLRAVSDFEFEFQMALTNRSLNEEMDTVFLMTDQKYSFLSSSIVKEIASLGGKIDHFVKLDVELALRKKYEKNE